MNTKIRGETYLFWIDTAKGFGVYLVFMGHLLYQTNLSLINTMIYSFHMPFFVILSGYVLNTEKYGGIISMCERNMTAPCHISSLILP